VFSVVLLLMVDAPQLPAVPAFADWQTSIATGPLPASP
jgi:hypothetical protein